MRWTEVPIHMIDFEGSLATGIIEFGVVTLVGGEVTTTRTRLCGATGRMRPEDVEIHGIAPEMVRGLAPFADEFAYFADLRAWGPFAAHFAQAENTLIKGSWAYTRESPNFGRPGETTSEWGPWIDSGRLYLELYGTQAGGGKLAELIARFGLQEELDWQAGVHCPPERRHYHAALYDALAAALLLSRLGKSEEFSWRSLPWIFQHSTANAEKRDALSQGEWDLGA